MLQKDSMFQWHLSEVQSLKLAASDQRQANPSMIPSPLIQLEVRVRVRVPMHESFGRHTITITVFDTLLLCSTPLFGLLGNFSAECVRVYSVQAVYMYMLFREVS